MVLLTVSYIFISVIYFFSIFGSHTLRIKILTSLSKSKKLIALGLCYDVVIITFVLHIEPKRIHRHFKYHCRIETEVGNNNTTSIFFIFIVCSLFPFWQINYTHTCAGSSRMNLTNHFL